MLNRLFLFAAAVSLLAAADDDAVLGRVATHADGVVSSCTSLPDTSS